MRSFVPATDEAVDDLTTDPLGPAAVGCRASV
jgi:hypothetical protein